MDEGYQSSFSKQWCREVVPNRHGAGKEKVGLVSNVDALEMDIGIRQPFG